MNSTSPASCVLTRVRDARRKAPPLDDPAYGRFPRVIVEHLAANWPAVLSANGSDIEAARDAGVPAVLVDRLRLGDGHLRQLAEFAERVSVAQPALTAPDTPRQVGGWGRIRRIAKPLGVVLMVYEARPTVTIEGALLSASAGNAVLLRGGREIAATNAALATVIASALAAAGLPGELVVVLDDPDRSQLRELLTRADAIDVLIPRGSPSLIGYCRQASTIPVIASGGGVNHLYVHASADLAFAARAALDSKIPEPTACNTVEMVLADAEVAEAFLAALAQAAACEPTGVAILADPGLRRPEGVPDTVTVAPVSAHDFGREFLDRTIAVHVVSGLPEAVAHIARYGSGHTEGIIATSDAAVAEFCRHVDAAALVVNGSLRLHDGPTLQLGPELSISTGRLHVRGPVTLTNLITHSWVVEATGTLRADLQT